MSPRLPALRRVGLVGLGALIAGALALAALWFTPAGRVAVADVYWNVLLTLALVDPAEDIGPHLWAVAVSPDGETIAVGGMIREVLLFDAGTGEPRPSPFSMEQWVMEVGWSPDGRWFAASSFDGEVRVIETRTGAEVARFRANEVSYTFAYHPTLPLFAWGAYDGSIRIVDLSTGVESAPIVSSAGGVLFLTFLPDGRWVASTGEDGRVYFHDPLTRVEERVLQAHAEGITSISFSPDGKLMVTGGDDSYVRLWDVDSMTLLREHSPHPGWINFTTFLPGRGRWLSVGTDDAVHIWDVGGHGPSRALPGHPGGLMCVRPFPDGSRFVTSGKDGTLRIWDADSLRVIRSIDVWGSIDPGGWRWPML